jgi:hypothetical protein
MTTFAFGKMIGGRGACQRSGDLASGTHASGTDRDGDHDRSAASGNSAASGTLNLRG